VRATYRTLLVLRLGSGWERGIGRVVNASRWPPSAAAVHAVSAAGKAPTALRLQRNGLPILRLGRGGQRGIGRVVNTPRWPPSAAAVHAVSAAGKAPTALRLQRNGLPILRLGSGWTARYR